jgi:S-formylglutathione hydrolase FrmB
MSRPSFPDSLVFAIFCCIAITAAAPPVQAAARIECRSVKSEILKHNVRYCIFLPPSYDSSNARRFPILYYLHGLGFDEQAMVDTGGYNLIEDLWEELQVGEFLIAAPDGDTSFFINSQDGKQRYEDFFISEFLPAMERRYRVQADREHRGITGMSMGGYGAMHLAFLHTDLFGSVSAHSAALIARLPAPRGKANRVALPSVFGKVFGAPFDREFWDRNDPVRIARDAPALNRLKIYFDCGGSDDYGFQAGAKLLDETLTDRGIAHEYHMYPGRHDVFYFASHFDASLRFHSRAFGLSATGK